MGVIPFTRAPSPRPAQHVLDSKERGHRPKERFRQNILAMGGCFFFLGLPLRRCVCLSSCRSLGVAWVASARCLVRLLRCLLLLVPWCFRGVFFLLLLARCFFRCSLHQKHRVLGTHCRERRDGSDGWRSPVPRATILGVEVVYFLRQPSLPGPPTGPEHSDASWCGRCTRWQVVCTQTGSFTRVCSGTWVRSTRGVAASFLTRCRGSRIFVSVAAATLASCRGTSQQNIASQMFLQLRR